MVALLLLAAVLSLSSGCEPYSQARDEHAANLVLDTAREAGFPVRLVAANSASDFPAVVARERSQDPWSTLLVYAGSDCQVDAGVKLAAESAHELAARCRSNGGGPSEPAPLFLARSFVENLEKTHGIKPLEADSSFRSGISPANDYLLALVIGFSILGISIWLTLSKRTRASLDRARSALLARLRPPPSTEKNDAQTPPLRTGLLLILALLAIGGAYVSTLSSPFMWDDRQLILEEIIDGNATPGDAFMHPFWRSTETGIGYRGFFRPLTTLSFVVDAQLGGGNSTVFHLTNILLHLGVVLLGFVLARRLGARRLPALLAVLCFGLAPRLTEDVAWISGRTDVLAALFGLGALCCYPFRLLPAPRHVLPRICSSATLLGLGLLAKEVALAFLVVVALDEIIYRRRHSDAGAIAPRALPFVAVIAIYLGLRFHVLGSVLSTDAEYAYGGSRWLAGLEALGRYGTMLLNFMGSATQIGFLPSRVWSLVALGAGVGVAIVLWTLSSAKRISSSKLPSPGGATLLGWLAIAALVPVLHVVPLPANVVAADRFLYVPLLGLSLVTAIVASRCNPVWRSRAVLLVLPFAGLSAGGTLIRNQDYASEVSFWVRAVVSTRAENTLPVRELANVYFRAQAHDLAAGLYMRALREERQHFVLDARWRQDPLGQLSNAESALGNYQEAIRLGQKLLATGLATPRQVHNLALAYLHVEDFENARRLSELALAQSPEYSPARQTLERLPDLEKERAALEELPPSSRDAARARYYARIGARIEAQRAYAAFLDHPRLDAQTKASSWEYLILFGDASVLQSVAARHPVNDPLLQAALESRLSIANEIAASLPSVRPYLARYDALELGL
jgi:tetratricopeptide (TPR) repeat protein